MRCTFFHRLLRVALGPLAILGASTPSQGKISPTWQMMRDAPPEDVFKVAQFMEVPEGRHMVLLSGGKIDGLTEGATLKVYRPAAVEQGPKNGHQPNDPLWVEMGQLKVTEVQDRLAVARVEKQGSEIVQALFPKFPEIMAGDFAVVQRVSIVRRPLVIPQVMIAYKDLFADPNAQPGTYELTSQGTEKLREIAKSFAHARLSMLMIEGYTDPEGPASANQVESYQRALTVRQFLIDEVGFDETRVVAVGFGEAENIDRSHAPGSQNRNRRIVFKAIAAQPTTIR